MAECGFNEDVECRNKSLALRLKIGATIGILCASALGVALPLIGKGLRFLRTDGNFFFIAKAFAAGVILATGFVHMLPDAVDSLTSKCLPAFPWSKFPFPGFVAMLAALGTLFIDFVGTEYYEKKHFESKQLETPEAHAVIERDDNISMTTESPSSKHIGKQENGKGSHIHIVGMRAHAASHSHSHPEGHHHCVDLTHEHNQGHIGHAHMSDVADQEAAHIRHVVISQVLELGIVAHSIIIGVSLGVSQSPCTIRPLIAALCFHQFFEGFALGGCISQARYKATSSAAMATFFAMTTPLGISVGIAIASSYNDNSPRALIVEGLFDSVSAGILIYMALVDLIAADFLSKRMRCNRRLQVFSYMSLFGGVFAMSALAIWA